MGLKVSPDIAQALIEDILHGANCDAFCGGYMDGVGVFSNGSYEEHMGLIRKVLKELEKNGMKVNLLKYEWAVKETDFLGHWLTPDGIKPWKKKVEAVLKLAPPQDMTQVRAFIGAVTYYKNIWPCCSHLLAPLTDLTGRGKFRWLPHHQKAFDKMKSTMVPDALTAFPNHNLQFHTYTDASDYQLGAVIIQN
eukprot:11090857-Ditylum_brightwellii.AAC.1